MQLRAWMAQAGLSGRELGERIDATAQAVWRYTLPPTHPQCRIPDRRRMAAIYLATGGAVTPGDFYELPELPAAPAPAPSRVAAE